MLKYKLESLDGLDEATAKLYSKGDDGKFVLQVDETGAKSALQKERERADAAEKALKEREKAESEHKAAAERAELEKRGEYEKLRAQDTEALKAEKARADALEARLRSGSRDRALMDAMADPSVKAIPRALLPQIKDLVEDVPDGDGYKHVVKGNPGQKLTDFLAGFKAEMPWAFEGTGASGSGAPAGGRPAPSPNQPTTSVSLIASGLKQAGFAK